MGMRTGSCNMDLTLCRFLKVLLLECREGSIHKMHHKQVKMSSWMRAHALQMKREWQDSVQTETISGERSVPIMNMKSLTTSFPLRPAKISCLLTLMIPPHSFFSLSLFLGEEAEMEMKTVTCYWWKSSALQTAKESERKHWIPASDCSRNKLLFIEIAHTNPQVFPNFKILFSLFSEHSVRAWHSDD